MKKVIVLSLGVMFLAVLGTSCTKECTCKTYVNDVETSSTTQEHKGKCSELNSSSTTLGITQRIECN